MQNLTSIDHFQLDEKVDNNSIRVLQIITIGMVLPLMAMIVILVGLYVYYKQRAIPPEPASYEYLKVILLLLLSTSFINYMFFVIVPKRILSGQNTANASKSLFSYTKIMPDMDPVARALSMYRSILMVRLATLEGAALFGFVILLLTILNSVIYYQPLYWLCLLPAALMVAFVYLFFPTRERVLFYIENNILPTINQP